MAKSTNPFMEMLAAKKAGKGSSKDMKPSKGMPKGKMPKKGIPKGKGSK